MERVHLLGSMMTDDAKCTRESKSGISMAKATFDKKKNKKKKHSLHHKIGLKFKEETIEMLHLERSFVWCWYLDTSESGSEMPGKFSNMAQGKDGDQLDRLCEK